MKADARVGELPTAGVTISIKLMGATRYPVLQSGRASPNYVRKVVSLKGFDQTGRSPGLEFSLDWNGTPMLLKDNGTQELYSVIGTNDSFPSLKPD